jgi:hypothetical protein
MKYARFPMTLGGRTMKPSLNGKKVDLEKDVAESYNRFKEFHGHRYTGMKVGRSHKWYYDKGEWKEKKITPDEWEIHYAVTKRRAGHAPEGSGVPVGTGYHWYILAHQNVTKLNANDYSTSMTGLKFKLAHKRAGTDKWSAGPRAQRNHLIKILKQMVQDLESQTDEVEQPAAKAAPEPVKRIAIPRPARKAMKVVPTARRKAKPRTHVAHVA